MRTTVSVVAVLLLAACGSGDEELGKDVRYYAGDAVGKHKLHTDQEGEFSVRYGDCEPKSDAGCPAPISVSSWKPCRFRVPPGKLPRAKLRGVEARFFDGPILLANDARRSRSTPRARSWRPRPSASSDRSTGASGSQIHCHRDEAAGACQAR